MLSCDCGNCVEIVSLTYCFGVVRRFRRFVLGVDFRVIVFVEIVFEFVNYECVFDD